MEKYNYFLSSFIANVRNFKNLTQKTQYKFGAIPEFMQKLLDAGGAINYAKTKINL